MMNRIFEHAVSQPPSVRCVMRSAIDARPVGCLTGALSAPFHLY